ncbi:hypothetical protein [Streptomyces sp. NPDC056468]|uniref:hypothetical protein n=1 Tax=Streptomyces sp. NPDC056468 TaxID=3345830 RepID=UPI003674B410
MSTATEATEPDSIVDDQALLLAAVDSAPAFHLTRHTLLVDIRVLQLDSYGIADRLRSLRLPTT